MTNKLKKTATKEKISPFLWPIAKLSVILTTLIRMWQLHLIGDKLCNACCPSMMLIRIRDPVPFWPLDQGSGRGKNQDPDPGWTTRIIFPRAKKHFFRLRKYLNPLMRIQDLGWKNSDPGWEKTGSGITSRIRNTAACPAFCSCSCCRGGAAPQSYWTRRPPDPSHSSPAQRAQPSQIPGKNWEHCLTLTC